MEYRLSNKQVAYRCDSETKPFEFNEEDIWYVRTNTELSDSDLKAILNDVKPIVGQMFQTFELPSGKLIKVIVSSWEKNENTHTYTKIWKTIIKEN